MDTTWRLTKHFTRCELWRWWWALLRLLLVVVLAPLLVPPLVPLLVLLRTAETGHCTRQEVLCQAGGAMS